MCVDDVRVTLEPCPSPSTSSPACWLPPTPWFPRSRRRSSSSGRRPGSSRVPCRRSRSSPRSRSARSRGKVPCSSRLAAWPDAGSTAEVVGRATSAPTRPSGDGDLVHCSWPASSPAGASPRRRPWAPATREDAASPRRPRSGRHSARSTWSRSVPRHSDCSAHLSEPSLPPPSRWPYWAAWSGGSPQRCRRHVHG